MSNGSKLEVAIKKLYDVLYSFRPGFLTPDNKKEVLVSDDETEQKRILWAYKTGWICKDINDLLYKKEWEGTIAELDIAVGQFLTIAGLMQPREEETTVYRGTRLSHVKPLINANKEDVPSLKLEGLISTSGQKDVAEDYVSGYFTENQQEGDGLRIKMKIPAGIPMLPDRLMAAAYHEEDFFCERDGFTYERLVHPTEQEISSFSVGEDGVAEMELIATKALDPYEIVMSTLDAMIQKEKSLIRRQGFSRVKQKVADYKTKQLSMAESVGIEY